ncbi:MAG: site-2 protease family protein [Alphaproteobacteria bacterium]|nr:MAG: site-2 protease family protein [Alphaproteobacteria bacterium]
MLSSLLLFLKASKFGPMLLTCGTMLISIAAYAHSFGWLFSAGIVLLILVHEMGHYIAARQRGLKVGAPTFIPFVGAWIDMKDKPHNVETEAYVGLAGPLVGTLGALAVYYAARHYDSTFLLALSYTGFMLNLFNLIPMSPLDGGRITAVLSPRIWLLGAPLLVGLYFWNHNPLIILIGLFAWPQLVRAWRYDPKAPENAAYYSISAEHRLFYTTFYLLLTGFLALMSFDLHNTLHPGA